MDRARRPRTDTVTGNMELILPPTDFDPEQIISSPKNQEHGIPNARTIRAMNEARDGKNLVKFNDAKAFFDDLEI